MDFTSPSAGRTIPVRFLENLAKNADLVALRVRLADGTYSEWTYRQYADYVARCAAGLQALGFGPGKRLVLMIRNRPEFHALDMAAYFCGGTAVSIYNSSSTEQIKYMLDHCEAMIAIADDCAFFESILAVSDELPNLRHLGVLGTEGPPSAFHWEALVDQVPIDLERAARVARPDDLATLIYTSGTTGPSKGVMITHQSVVSAVESIDQLLAQHPKLANGVTGLRVVSYLPMAHVAERISSHYFAAFAGQQVTCCPEPTQLAMHLREVRPQILFGVPRVWEKLYASVQAALSASPERAPKLAAALEAALPLVEKIQAGTATEQEQGTYQFLDEVAFKSLRGSIGLDEVILAVTGAASMSPDHQLWFRAIGVPISDVYGMSESCGAITWSPLQAKPGSVGKPVPGMEVKLADDGEIMCRGAAVFGGYLEPHDETEESLDAEGWLHSGDIGQLDEDGYLRIVDRKKELIITAGGKNVSPANLEVALKSIPLVGPACAIGNDRPFISALIVLDPDRAQAWAASRGIANATLADLAMHSELIAEIEAGLAAAMANFNSAERVKRITILGTEWLPASEELTPTSKLRRRAIDAKYAREIESLYATTLAPPQMDVARKPSGKRALG